jgi:predicted enzyme related to lactoylglutathione lyase
MLKISSILIGVSNLDKARPFYENVLGFTFDEFRPPFASATFDGIEFNIEENAPYREAGWAKNHIGGRKPMSFKTDNLDTFLEKAQKSGATIIQKPEEKPWGWRESVISDMDGNEFLVEQEVIKE